MNPTSRPSLGPFASIAELGLALRSGETTCLAILDDYLARIDHLDGEIRAWVVVDRAGAREQAVRLDDSLATGEDHGPLHGIPIAIKDIIDVAGLPTGCGSARWAARLAGSDADVVVRLRQAGAVIMGKTVTTPYAWVDPPRTRNPWNLERTPGGSSSGSAAAVAAGMCAGAIGSQTGGSIIRPASFCGVAGLKPTRGAISTRGVFPLARSLDHVGPIARSVVDLAAIFHAIEPSGLPLANSLANRPPRIGRLGGYFDRRLDPDARLAINHALAALSEAGATVIDHEGPLDFDAVMLDHRRVMAHEAAELHSDWLAQYPDDYPPRIRSLILEGQSIANDEYRRSRDTIETAAGIVHQALSLGRYDALSTPATTGPAPDPSTTGDPAFNSPFSFTGNPCVSFPVGLAPDGPPLALQLIGARDRDLELLECARWCEQAIHVRGLWRTAPPPMAAKTPETSRRRRS